MIKYRCHFDGSYRNHDGKEDMGIGCVICDQNNKTVFELARHIEGEGSTNFAEYSACIEVLKWLSENPHDKAIVRGDSKLVVKQLHGEWSIKKGVYMPKAKEAIELYNNLPKVDVKWTSRKNNTRADELSKMGLNNDNYIMKHGNI